MAELPEALDRALREHFQYVEVKTPATQKRGLQARMNQLEKAFAKPGDRKGSAGRRAAKAAGIAPDTWTRWKNQQRKPGAASLRKLEAAYKRLVTVPKARKVAARKGIPNKVNVRADVRWNGYVNRIVERTVRFTDMRDVMVNVIRVWNRAGPEAAAGAFEEGIALKESAETVQFEGDNVIIEFPGENQ